MAVSAAPTPQPFRTRLSAFFYRHRWLKLALLLLPPLLWICVVYLGALAALLAHSLWTTNDLTQEGRAHVVARQLPHAVGDRCLPHDHPAHRRASRSAVTHHRRHPRLPARLLHGADRLTALRAIVFVAVLMPLWSSYLVRVYTWRLILPRTASLNWTLEKLGVRIASTSRYSMWAMWIATATSGCRS